MLRDRRVVVEPVEALREGVQHPQPARERIDQVVVAAVLPAHPHPERRARREGADPAPRDLQVGGLREQLGCPRQRLDRRALRHRAHPRRAAAAELEPVLPGREPTAARSDRHQLVEQLPQALLPAGTPQTVRLPEVGERLDLEPVARVVLEDQLAARERDPLPARRERAGRPVLRVALELQEEGRHAAGGQLVGTSDRLERGDHRAQLVAPRPGQIGARAERAAVGPAPLAPLVGRDLAGFERAPEGLPDRRPGRGAGARRRRGTGGRGHEVRLGAWGEVRVVAQDRAVRPHLEHGRGLGGRRDDGRSQCERG